MSDTNNDAYLNESHKFNDYNKKVHLVRVNRHGFVDRFNE